MYVSPNFKTKKALKEALKAGAVVYVYQPNDMRAMATGNDVAVSGTVYLEGPHYPEPHKWYAEGKAEGGVLKSVK